MVAEPPFDPRWLDELAGICGSLARANPSLNDVFLEQRLELRVTVAGSVRQVEECRTEGAAARWRFPGRSVLHACSGVSAQVVAELLKSHHDRVSAPTTRPVPPAELDPPRGWLDWGIGVAERTPGARAVVRFLNRRAVVVRERQWVVVQSPPLVRVEINGARPASLLSVLDHPQLSRWLQELMAPPPQKTWQPPSGVRVPVLFSAGTAGILLHELIGHPAESDLVLSGDSPLSSLGDALVTAPSVEIVDDPSRQDLAGGFSHDDEGVSAEPQRIVHRGRLVGWLCDREGAQRLESPPGRGRRSSWGRPPAPRLSNLVVNPGDIEPASLERDLRKGLLITRIGGATVDPVSKRVVLRVERGWELQNGRRRRPLAVCELTGSALEVAAHLEPSLGSDPTPDWRLGWCVKDGLPLPTGSEAPSMLVHRLEVL
jgi:hypothetical protein